MKKVKRVGKRICSHPLLTPEKKAELKQAAQESARLPVSISSALDEYIKPAG